MTSPNFDLLALSTTSDIIDLPFIFNKGLFGNLEAESLDGINKCFLHYKFTNLCV